ncbi:hypothetical protein EG68_01349, partial [Paragonimus skrjabini miyazakii]
ESRCVFITVAISFRPFSKLVISDSLIAEADEAEEPTLSPRHPEWLTGREFERSTDHNIHKSEESAIMRDRTDEEKDKSRPNSPQLDVVESDQLGQKWYGIGRGELSHLRRLIHSKYRAGSSLHLAESTVSAVQTALNRRAAHVHRLRYRTNGLRDQLQNLLKRSDELENERRRANEQLCRLRQEMETQNLELDKVARERDRIKHSLNLTAEEHKLSETTRTTLSEQVRDLKAEVDRHRTIVQDITKERDDILGEKEKLSAEQERTLREIASVKAALQNAEDRATSYREELTTIRETLRRAELEKEVLGQEKTDAIGTASRVQARIEDLERKVNQARLQETQCRDKIAQLEALIENHERENQQLTQQNALAHSNELRLTEERSSLRAEKQQLREELDKIYLERGNLNAELEQSREQSLKMETAKNRLEAETSELSQERLALVEALNTAERQKTAMLEDLHALRRDSDRQSNYISRLMSEKESLTKHKAEISIQLTILERDARQQLDQISRLKNEKETLEANLFDAQQLNDQLQNRQTSMEREIGELKLRRETLQAELLRAHTNFQVELDKSQRSQQEIGSQLNTELEELRNALTQAERRAKEAEDACLHAVRRADQAVAVLDRKQKLEVESTTDREQDLRKSAEEVNRLTRALLAVQRERDEARMHTEQERHRALLRAADEKACLQERVALLQQTITDLQKALESSQQENNFKSEQDRITLKKATEEVRVFRNQLEEACTKHEREVRELRIRVRDLEAQRDKLLKESTELQLQARLAEESRNGKRAELTESTSRVRTELRQKISEIEGDKHALDTSNNELRRQLKTAELERVELIRITNITRSQLQGIELDRNTAEKRIADLQENVKDAVASASEARREASELRNKVKKLIFERDSLDQELNEVRNQMSLTQNKEETLKREKTTLKQRLLELESSKTALQSDLASLSRQHCEMEETIRSRERAASQAAEEWNRDYRRLDEANKNLEAKLEHSNLIVGELRASLAESQAHLKGVECELTDTLGAKQEAEARLSAIHSILRRLLGFRQSQYLRDQENAQNAETFRTQKDLDVSVTDGLNYLEDAKSRDTCDSPQNTEMQEQEGRHRLPTDERDSEVEIRRMVEKIMNDNMKLELTSTFPKPRQRGRRRLYYETTDHYVPLARQTRSSTRSRRSKSSSPLRERFQSLADRPISAERRSRSKNKAENTASNLHGSGTFGLTDELGLVAVSPGWTQTLRLHRNGVRYRGLPGSDLDPEAVRLVIRAFLRHLVHIERERDTKEMKVRLSEEQMLELKQQLAECERRTAHLQAVIGGTEKEKLDMLEQLTNTKLSVSERESLLSRSVEKYDLLHGRYQIVEQQWSICESEKKQLQNRLDKMKTSELRLEEDRRQLLRALDDVETRYTEAEVARQRLESDLQRAQGVITELEREKQTTQERMNAISHQKCELETRIYTLQNARDQITNNLDQSSSKVVELNVQLERELREKETLREEIMELRDRVERINRSAIANDQERRLLQERLETTRLNLHDTKAQLQEATERLQELQLETSDGAIRRAELESQLRQLTNMSSDSQQVNMDLQNKIAKLQNEQATLMEKNNELMRKGNEWCSEKQNLENEINRMRKEQMQLKKTIDRIDRDRSQQQELYSKLQTENKDFLQSIRRLEEENLNLRRDLQKLQVSLLKTQLAQEISRRTPSSFKPIFLSEHISPNQSNLLQFGSPNADVELPETLSRADGSLPQDIVLSGLYKPTAAPSRYDPYYYQVTGSIPARLDRSYGASRVFNRERETESYQRATHQPSIIPKDGDSHQTLTEGTEGNGKSGLRSGAGASNIIHSSISRMSALFGDHGYHESTPGERLNRSISESLIRRHLER